MTKSAFWALPDPVFPTSFAGSKFSPVIVTARPPAVSLPLLIGVDPLTLLFVTIGAVFITPSSVSYALTLKPLKVGVMAPTSVNTLSETVNGAEPSPRLTKTPAPC